MQTIVREGGVEAAQLDDPVLPERAPSLGIVLYKLEDLCDK